MTGANKIDHITPILENLNWRKIEDILKHRDQKSFKSSEWAKNPQLRKLSVFFLFHFQLCLREIVV